MHSYIKYLIVLGALTFTVAAPVSSQGDDKKTTESVNKTAEKDLPEVSTRLKMLELKDHPFKVAGIELTILDFNEEVLFTWAFSTYHAPGVGGITVNVANTSKDFSTFSPAKLIIVGSDGNQATVAREEFDAGIRVPVETQLAPGGRLKTKYTLTAGVTLPARIYYDQKLLAEVSD